MSKKLCPLPVIAVAMLFVSTRNLWNSRTGRELSNMLKSGGSATSDSKVNDDAIVDKTKQPQPGLPVSLPQLPGFTGLSQCTINFSFNNYSNK